MVQNALAGVRQPWRDAMEPRLWDNEGRGTTPALLGQATQAMTMLLTLLYLGMSVAIQKWGTGDTVSQGQEVAWQRGVEGDKTKITQFQEMIGALQEFKTCLFMKKESAFCTIIHLPTNFLALNKATQHLQGCFIGFIGDRTLMRDPTPILLQTQKTWQWVEKWWPRMGLLSSRFMRRTCRGKGHCGQQQLSVKEPRAMYCDSYTYHWCCSC
jgi:hypothetical protein